METVGTAKEAIESGLVSVPVRGFGQWKPPIPDVPPVDETPFQSP